MEATTHDPGAPKQATILLVDDEPDLLALSAAILSDAGYVSLASDSGPKALALLEETPTIDLVISDIKMPGMDGLALLAAIRESFANRPWLQVVFVTGHASIESAVAALRLDAVDFLHKPLRANELLATVKNVSQKAVHRREIIQAIEASHAQLDQLSDEARRITQMLETLAVGHPLPTQRSADGASEPRDVQASDVASNERLLRLIRARDIRSRFFDDPLFTDPVWHMLLDLMESRLLARPVFATNLYVAAGVPMSTASRRLDDLVRAKFVRRWDDPSDRRRQRVDLMPRTAELLTQYLTALDQQLT